MTAEDHPSGTDRVAEAARIAENEDKFTHVINVQGDEPLISPDLIDSLAEKMREDSEIEMITAANALDDDEEYEDPNVVKVVVDALGRALYFSRSPIPHRRNEVATLPNYRHNGIYGFRSDFLQRFVAWPPSELEQVEGLEQLRAVEHGVRIHVVVTTQEALGVDTPEQVAAIEQMLKDKNANHLNRQPITQASPAS